jgi:TonB family protein
MSRHWFLVVSGVAHVAVAIGVFASAGWSIERLEAGRARHEITVPLRPPPEPPGGPVAAVAPRFERKHPPITHRVTQPPDHPPVADPGPPPDSTGTGTGPGVPIDVGICRENCGESPPAAPVCGNGALELGEQCDDGNTASGDGCSASCRTEPAQIATIAPGTIEGLRVSGETQIRPSAATQQQMMRAAASGARGTVALCISRDGSVSSATMMRPTGYPDYDAAILSAVHDWRYRPYTVSGIATAACSAVTFVYTIR